MGHWCSYHIFISVIFREITQPRRRRWRHRDLKKMERFSEQNNNSARASHLLLHFGAFTARPRHEIPNSMFYVGQKHKTMIFSFFLNLDMVLENSIPEKFAYLWQVNRNVIFAMRFGKQRELTLSVKFSLLSPSWLRNFRHNWKVTRQNEILIVLRFVSL